MDKTNIIEQLYYGNISGERQTNRPPKDDKIDKEHELYDKLENELTEEQCKQFDDFVDLYGLRCADEEKDVYVNAFKTGLLIGIECSKLDI